MRFIIPRTILLGIPLLVHDSAGLACQSYSRGIRPRRIKSSNPHHGRIGFQSWLNIRGGDGGGDGRSLQHLISFASNNRNTIRVGSTAGASDNYLASTKNENLQGILYMALSALSFSLMFLGVKLYSSAPTFTLIFYRSVVQSILSLLMILKDRTAMKNKITKTESPTETDVWDCRKLLFLRGTFGSAAVGAFFYAIQNLPLPDAITLQFTTPVFAAILAVPLLGEVWTRSDQIAALVCLCGVLLMARPSWLFGAATTTVAAASSVVPTVVGLVGAALAALAYILVRKIGKRADANTMVLYYALISGLSAPLGAHLLSGGGSGVSSWNVLGHPTFLELLVFAGLGVFGFLGQLWTNMGLTKCDSAATATLVTNSQIVFAFLFEVTVLHESLSISSVAGTALIVGYMLFAGISKLSKERQEVME